MSQPPKKTVIRATFVVKNLQLVIRMAEQLELN